MGALGISMVPFPLRVWAQTQLPAKGKRQYLINACDVGGWDQNWFANYFAPDLNSRVSVIPDNATYRNGSGVPLSPMYSRYRYQTGTHVLFDGQKLAPGMKFWTTDDFSRLCLWRGARSATGHTQQAFFYRGGISPYMASASSLIAAYQAQTRGALPLHYVKLAGTPSEVPVSSGMMTGIAIASCVPDQTTWQTLTSKSVGATQAVLDENQLIQDAVEQLSAAVRNRLTRGLPKEFADGYKSSFTSSQLLSRSGYAASDEFFEMWRRYFNAIVKEAQDHITNGLGNASLMGANSNYDWIQSFFNNSDPAKPGYNLMAITLPTTVADFKTLRTAIESMSAGSAFNYRRRALSISWKCAMAAFLVTHDLSAVVDFVMTGSDDQYGDVHEDKGHDVCSRILGMAGFRELTRHLASVPHPDGQGTLLDCTLITYGSEFSRSGYFNSDKEQGGWGTTHNYDWPFFMSGHLSNMGHCFGSGKIGDAASVPTELRYGPVSADDSVVPSSAAGWFGTPVAQDRQTGAILGGSAQGVSPLALFPTIMKMFGVPIPPQQVTDQTAIPFLSKAG